MSGCCSSGGRSFQILGPATEKSLSRKLFCARGTMHVLQLAVVVVLHIMLDWEEGQIVAHEVCLRDMRTS